jgi:deoxyxylulose-5-phosphate synthase
MAMPLDEAGVITDTELMGGYRREGIAAVRDTRGRLVITEDHRREGGLGSAVLEVLAGKDTPPLRLAHLAVRFMPGLGMSTELHTAAAIDAASIGSAARHLPDGTHREPDHQDASTAMAQRRSVGPT